MVTQTVIKIHFFEGGEIKYKISSFAGILELTLNNFKSS